MTGREAGEGTLAPGAALLASVTLLVVERACIAPLGVAPNPRIRAKVLD